MRNLLLFLIKNKDQLHVVMKSLEKIEGVSSVERIDDTEE